MHFPPSFFDVMVHLSVHLVREVKLCGPVYEKWMYPFERFMWVLKGYVQNKNRPEASMVKAYIVEEAINLCSDVLSYLPPIGIPERHNDSSMGGFGLLAPDVKQCSRKLFTRAQHTVLVNSEPITPYVKCHMNFLEGQSWDLGKEQWWINKEHTRSFANWFKMTIMEELQSSPSNVSDALRLLSYGARPFVVHYRGYVINGQNSGVSLKVDSVSLYFEKIKEIWSLNYMSFTVPLFKCHWANSCTGVHVDNMGFTLVDFNRLGHLNDPFIMAAHARLVFYVKGLTYNTRLLVLSCHALFCSGLDPSMIEDQQMGTYRFRCFGTSGYDNDDEPNYSGNGFRLFIRRPIGTGIVY